MKTYDVIVTRHVIEETVIQCNADSEVEARVGAKRLARMGEAGPWTRIDVQVTDATASVNVPATRAAQDAIRQTQAVLASGAGTTPSAAGEGA